MSHITDCNSNLIKIRFSVINFSSKFIENMNIHSSAISFLILYSRKNPTADNYLSTDESIFFLSSSSVE